MRGVSILVPLSRFTMYMPSSLMAVTTPDNSVFLTIILSPTSILFTGLPIIHADKCRQFIFAFS